MAIMSLVQQMQALRQENAEMKESLSKALGMFSTFMANFMQGSSKGVPEVVQESKVQVSKVQESKTVPKKLIVKPCRCAAMTAKNQPCKKSPLEGEIYCEVHLENNYESEDDEDAKEVIVPIQQEQRRLCSAMTHEGPQCSKRAQPGSCYCGTHLRSIAIKASKVCNYRSKCRGITKAGHACSFYAQEGRAYCGKH